MSDVRTQPCPRCQSYAYENQRIRRANGTIDSEWKCASNCGFHEWRAAQPDREAREGS